MSDDAVRKMIREMTAEERQELAKKMITPIRCGGAVYRDGKRHLLLQGWLVPEDIIPKTGDPWPAIREYQATHEPYAEHPRGKA